MKKLLVLSAIAGGVLFTNSAFSQVYVNAHIGFGVPARGVYVAPAPVVCEDAYPTTVYENDFPGYVYYNYPTWNGHYRDRVYYEHYRPFFERDYRGYFRGRTFDHGRFERDYRGRANYGDRGYHRGWENRRGR